MAKDYVERRHESFYLTGSRVPLAHIVHDFTNGETAETIQSHFSTLTLEQVYGALAFYLGSKEEVERDMAERRRNEEEFVRSQPPLPPNLKRKLDRARDQLLARRS